MRTALFLLSVLPLLGQRQELGLLLGGFKPASRTLTVTPPAKADFTAGLTYYANYGIRIAGGGGASLWFEVPFAATPQHRIESASGLVTRDVATLYITPGLRLKFASGRRVQPYIAAGAGYALFEHSTLRGDGRENAAPRTLGRGAFQFGGGVDVAVWRWFGLRGEFRDFVSGSPAFNLPVKGSLQHNALFAGGFVLKF